MLREPRRTSGNALLGDKPRMIKESFLSIGRLAGTSRRAGEGRSPAVSTGACRAGSTAPLNNVSSSIAKSTGLRSASRIPGRRRNVAMRVSSGTGETCAGETGSVAYRAAMRTMPTSTRPGTCASSRWSEPMVSASSKATAMSDRTRLLLTISSGCSSGRSTRSWGYSCIVLILIRYFLKPTPSTPPVSSPPHPQCPSHCHPVPCVVDNHTHAK